jgi:hypothetical protein
MNTFSINEAAAAEIRRLFRQFNCRDPVAYLYERADTGNMFDEVTSALLDGAQSTEDLSAMARRRFSEVEGQLKPSLAVGAGERAEFRPEDLYEMDGITFVMDSRIREMLCGCRLTFEDGHFLLRDEGNVAHTLRSLASTRKGQ